MLRSLVVSPDILLLDEPSSNLNDAMSRRLLTRIFRDARENGRIVLLASHERWVVDLADDRRAVTPDGDE